MIELGWGVGDGGGGGVEPFEAGSHGSCAISFLFVMTFNRGLKDGTVSALVWICIVEFDTVRR